MTGDRKIGKAAVTGASGYIGAELVRALSARGIEVRALVRDPAKARKADGVELFRSDITSPDSLRGAFSGIDTVFHTAALVGGITLGDAALRAVNVEGTRNVTVAAEASGTVSRLVHISTVGVMGWTDSTRPIQESDPPRPRSPYGRTKLESESVALGSAGSMEVVIARPMWVYGETSPSTVKLFEKMARRRMILVGEARNLIQPVYINDLLSGLLRCAEGKNVQGEIIQFAGPSAMTTKQMCTEIAQAVGAREPDLHLPLWIGVTAAIALERIFAGQDRKLPIDRDKIDLFRLHHAYSLDKAARLLAWAPQISFPEASRRIAAHLRSSGAFAA
jgi:nucleoside-diphosphate-sugar epimerase